MGKINNKLIKARDLIMAVGEEIECDLPTELNFINEEISELLESLNNIIDKEIDKLLQIR